MGIVILAEACLVPYYLARENPMPQLRPVQYGLPVFLIGADNSWGRGSVATLRVCTFWWWPGHRSPMQRERAAGTLVCAVFRGKEQSGRSRRIEASRPESRANNADDVPMFSRTG